MKIIKHYHLTLHLNHIHTFSLHQYIFLKSEFDKYILSGAKEQWEKPNGPWVNIIVYTLGLRTATHHHVCQFLGLIEGKSYVFEAIPSSKVIHSISYLRSDLNQSNTSSD